MKTKKLVALKVTLKLIDKSGKVVWVKNPKSIRKLPNSEAIQKLDKAFFKLSFKVIYPNGFINHKNCFSSQDYLWCKKAFVLEWL